MFGYRAHEILGHRVADYYRGGLDEAQAVMTQLRADGKIRNRELGFRAKDGRWVETSKWIEQSLVAVARIQEMVARMQRIARVQYLDGESRSLPRLFDLRKASDAEDSPGASPPPPSPKSR